MVGTSLHSLTRIKKRSNFDGSCDVDVLLEGEEGKEDGKRRGRERKRRRRRRRRVEGEKVEKEGKEKDEEGEGTGKEKRCYMPDTYIHVHNKLKVIDPL